jgi:hypothetical protein
VTGVLGEPTAVCVRSSRPPARLDPVLRASCPASPEALPSQGGLVFGRRPGRSRSGLLSGTPSLRPALCVESPVSTALKRSSRERGERSVSAPHIGAGPREDRRYGGMDADLRGEPVQRGEWELIPAAPTRSRTTAC